MRSDYPVTVSIEVKTPEDLLKISPIIKKQQIDCPVYVVFRGDSYLIEFENEYPHTEIDTAILQTFENYECHQELSTGLSDIKIIIRRNSLNYLHELVSEYKYFIEARHQDETEIDKSVQTSFVALFGEEKRKYEVKIGPGINPATGEEGFLLIGETDAATGKPKILVNELFKTRDDAFWRGFHKMQPEIEKEFLEFNKPARKERKKKTKE